MSLTNEEIKVPENLEQECFSIYGGVLTHSKKQILKKLIKHAYLAGTRQYSQESEE
ncbi:MAG: hypothetical protein IJM48_06015 [Treponema sp.]|nr:hypothetical protein [Treponema sp.]